MEQPILEPESGASPVTGSNSGAEVVKRPGRDGKVVSESEALFAEAHVIEVTANPSTGRPRRTRGTVIGSCCPYCDFTANLPAILLAHLKDDHPGLKVPKPELIELDDQSSIQKSQHGIKNTTGVDNEALARVGHDKELDQKAVSMLAEADAPGIEKTAELDDTVYIPEVFVHEADITATNEVVIDEYMKIDQLHLNVDEPSGSEFGLIGVGIFDDGRYEDKEILQAVQKQFKPSHLGPLGDPNGRYPCYIQRCKWRGRYRQARSTHMRNVHPDWIRPPQFVLDRISRDGTLLPANSPTARYSCYIEGCPWKGQYRASRTNHMKSQHAGWIPRRTRAPNGGHVQGAQYACHVIGCPWRGKSRSTRAGHLKRVHPGFLNPKATQKILHCEECNNVVSTHKCFVDHMVTRHRIGGIVQRELTKEDDYESWFHAVQESFSIDFVKKTGMRTIQDLQVLYLYCSRSGGHWPDRNLVPHCVAGYQPRFAKVLPPRAKGERTCACFLRVVHSDDGRLSIIGCVEHTGHRLGTPMLRLSPNERDALDDYLYTMDANAALEVMMDRLRELEGITSPSYTPKPRCDDFHLQFVYAPTERESLRQFLTDTKRYPDGTIFGFDDQEAASEFSLSFGYMDEHMENLWRSQAHKGVCFEEFNLALGNWKLRITLTLVFDDDRNVRVAALYVSDRPDLKPLMDKLAAVWTGEIKTFVMDSPQRSLQLIKDHFSTEGQPVAVKYAEWHLLSDWAATLEQLVTKRVDKYSILCVLRRLLHTDDVTAFDQTVSELFEGLREMQLDEIAHFFDNLFDPEFIGFWSPLGQDDLFGYANPTLEYACRMLRDRYIACDQCSRIDEYVGFLIARLVEYNESEILPLVSSRAPETLAPDQGDEDEWGDRQRITPNGVPMHTGNADRLHPGTFEEIVVGRGSSNQMEHSNNNDQELQKTPVDTDLPALERVQLVEEVVEEEIELSEEQAQLFEKLVFDGQLNPEEQERLFLQLAGVREADFVLSRDPAVTQRSSST
ncbi:unnamed protein product, partial [Mesorhabditis spiculigera]